MTEDEVRARIAEARDLELTIKDLEERLQAAKSSHNTLVTEILPDMLDELGNDVLGFPAQGNQKGFDAKLTPFYSANIAAAWSPERRNEAFAALQKVGAENLIKTQIQIDFPRNNHAEAKAMVDALTKMGCRPTIKETVHPQTLQAWLREEYESGRPLPPLETIGARIGRIVKIKERS